MYYSLSNIFEYSNVKIKSSIQKRWSILFILFTLVIYQTMVSKNFSTLLDKYIVEDDTLKMGQLIREWEQVSPQDPELYTAKFNYYYIKSLSKKSCYRIHLEMSLITY